MAMLRSIDAAPGDSRLTLASLGGGPVSDVVAQRTWDGTTRAVAGLQNNSYIVTYQLLINQCSPCRLLGGAGGGISRLGLSCIARRALACVHRRRSALACVPRVYRVGTVCVARHLQTLFYKAVLRIVSTVLVPSGVKRSREFVVYLRGVVARSTRTHLVQSLCPETRRPAAVSQRAPVLALTTGFLLCLNSEFILTGSHMTRSKSRANATPLCEVTWLRHTVCSR